MKNTTLLFIFVLFTSTLVLADYRITRGPEVGEIYFIGPTVTGEGIYYSTDFGETATCMDSTLNTNINFLSICADLSPGVLYGYSMPENLYISYDYGQQGSWSFIENDVSYRITSGVSPGFVYSSIMKHSEDYGINFIQHSCNGFFGNLLSMEIDNQSNIGYAEIATSSCPDSIFFMISNDNFENLVLQNQFNHYDENISILTRGCESGELYAFGGFNSELRLSNNFGQSWDFKSNLVTYSSFTGGRQPGELYVLANYTQLMGEIKHTDIYHSLDYGETFTVYHPFSYGPDPYFANLEAEPLTGTAPLTVQFTDLSSGEDIQNWEWDFQNDGIIDSYEQNPEFTYQDTGYYNVKLKIQYGLIENGFIKTNYIHIIDSSGCSDEICNIKKIQLNNYPNPFNPETMIRFTTEPTESTEDIFIEIYNVKGQKVDELAFSNQQTEVRWYAEEFASGIYLYKFNIKNSPIKKMILLK